MKKKYGYAHSVNYKMWACSVMDSRDWLLTSYKGVRFPPSPWGTVRWPLTESPAHLGCRANVLSPTSRGIGHATQGTMSVNCHKITWQGCWYREAESDAAILHENCYAGKIEIKDGRCQPNKLESTGTSSSIRTSWEISSVVEPRTHNPVCIDSNSISPIEV